MAAAGRVESTGATFVHAFDDPACRRSRDDRARVRRAASGRSGNRRHTGRRRRPRLGDRDRASRAETGVALVGVQAAACAPYAGHDPTGPTIADGIAVKTPAELTPRSPRSRRRGRRRRGRGDLAGDRAPPGAVEARRRGRGGGAVAAVLGGHVPGDGLVCAVLAGGNIDATTCMSVTRYGLTSSGRHLVVRIVIPTARANSRTSST